MNYLKYFEDPNVSDEEFRIKFGNLYGGHTDEVIDRDIDEIIKLRREIFNSKRKAQKDFSFFDLYIKELDEIRKMPREEGLERLKKFFDKEFKFDEKSIKVEDKSGDEALGEKLEEEF